MLGIITGRDLALQVVAKAFDVQMTKAEDVMTHKIINCCTDDDIETNVEAMAGHRLR